MQLPPELKTTLEAVHAEQAAEWIHAFPTLLDDCLRRWSLKLTPPIPWPLTFGFVAPVQMADHTPAVLKLTPPGPGATHQLTAMEHFGAAQGAVRVIHADPALCAIVMTRITPGTSMLQANLSDDDATLAVAKLIADLQSPLTSAATSHRPALPTTADWMKGFDRLRTLHNGTTGPIPERIFEEGHQCFKDLQETTTAAHILHGDLHHGNILKNHRQSWVAIDPQGVIGDPAYEVGAWMRNPTPKAFSLPTVQRRLDILAEHTELDRERMRRWSMAQAILSACWSIEDRLGGWQPMLTLAQTLKEA